MKRFLALLILLVIPGVVAAQAPVLGQPLALVTLEDKGELLLQNDNFSYQTWRSDASSGKVHVLQYFPGTTAASKIFEPFSDRLLETFESGTFQFTTILNLDAAMWGTGSFVVSEAKASKSEFPLSAMVLDEEGTGASTWNLGKKGAALFILDRNGLLRYVAREALSEEQIQAQLELMRTHMQ